MYLLSKVFSCRSAQGRTQMTVAPCCREAQPTHRLPAQQQDTAFTQDRVHGRLVLTQDRVHGRLVTTQDKVNVRLVITQDRVHRRLVTTQDRVHGRLVTTQD